MAAVHASSRHCPVCRGPVPVSLRVPALHPRIAAARRPLKCQASKDGSSGNFLDQAIQWGAALVRSGLDRQAATVQRLRGDRFTAAEPLSSSSMTSAESAEQRTADRASTSSRDELEEEDPFHILPNVLEPPGLGDSFADWEQYYLSMDNAGSWHRVFVNLLHEAVEAENYQEASVFRDYTTRMESVDLLGEALDALDLAIEQEDYSTASLVRDNAGLQYRGWWYGTSSAHNEPHLLRVESCFGRMAGFRLSISDIVTVEAQRKDSLVQTISQLGQETRTGTTVLFASQAFPDEEELCLRSVGAPVMEVWPVRPGELTATVLDDPEEDSSSTGWTSTVISEDDPGGGGVSEVQVSGEGPAVMQELANQLEGLVEGLRRMQSSSDSGESSSEHPRRLRVQFEESDGSIRLSPFNEQRSTSSSTPASEAETSSQSAEAEAASAASSSEQQAAEASSSSDSQEPPGPSGRGIDDGDIPGTFTMYEVISNVPGEDEGASSYQQAMQALQQGSLEELPAFVEGEGQMFSRRPAAVFPVNRDRFVLNVLQRDDLEGEEQAQSSPAAAQGSSTAGLALGSFSGLQMDGLQVQVLPEGTQEDDADIKGKVDMILGLMDQTGRKVHPSFRGKLEAFLKHATVLQAATMGQPAGLQGSVSYSRLKPEDGSVDPFTGLFLAVRDDQANSNTLMPCLLRLERARNAAGRDSVTATKLLGVDAMPCNTVVFRAEVSRESRMPTRSMLMEELGVTARYTAQVRWGQDHVPASSQWKEGDLMTFSSSAFHHAELGLCTTSAADHMNIVWMSRIRLPDVE